MTRALVFDSGVGGLTIADELRKAAPEWIVDYAADSGFFPYGVKTDEELRARLPQLCAALVGVAKPDVLVIACNTASTLSLADIRAKVSVPVVGTVPAIKPAAEQTKTGVIGILATPGTVRRAYLDDLEEAVRSRQDRDPARHRRTGRYCGARCTRPANRPGTGCVCREAAVRSAEWTEDRHCRSGLYALSSHPGGDCGARVRPGCG